MGMSLLDRSSLVDDLDLWRADYYQAAVEAALAYLRRSTIVGSFEENVVLLCPSCHEQREAPRRAATDL